MRGKSLISNKKECYKCKSKTNLHCHHIFFGKNRKKSDIDGCWVWLCVYHHTGTNEAVHFNKNFDLELKRLCEKRWLEHNNKKVEDFIKRYYKNYL